MSDIDFELSETEKSRIKAEKEKYSRDYIDEVYERLLKQRGIIMLPVQHSFTIYKIKDITEGYKDLVRFVVKVNGEKFVVFRYKPTFQERIDVKEIMREADEAYKAGDYRKSRDLYLDILPIFSRPSSFIYSRLGLSLFKSGKKKQAIDYLLMANYMAKKEERDVDYTELINTLRFGVVGEAEKKVDVDIKDTDFDYWSEDDNFGVSNFDEINDYILLTGSDVETACRKFGLTEEKINIVKLLYAREFFMRKEAKKGDQFLKSYEESEFKTRASKTLYDEIKRTKKLYAHREEIGSKKLLLSLQPKAKNNN